MKSAKCKIVSQDVGGGSTAAPFAEPNAAYINELEVDTIAANAVTYGYDGNIA